MTLGFTGTREGMTHLLSKEERDKVKNEEIQKTLKEVIQDWEKSYSLFKRFLDFIQNLMNK